MPIILTNQSPVIWQDAAAPVPEPVTYAIEDLTHDLAVAFDGTPATHPATVAVRFDRTLAAEQYRVTVDAAANTVVVAGADELGCIYGLYAVSREWLGFEDFGFWNDQRPAVREKLTLPDDARLESKPAAVRYRGWFVNDEVLIVAWNIKNDNELTWRTVFATLLRCGGNLVIPGSGQNMAPHWDLARRMGLYVNQHHATPLGARLFGEAYPGVKPRWPEDRDKYEALWRESIEQRRGAKVVWTLGLRGSSDGPFWSDDPRHQTDEDRGRVITEAIRAEYDLVRAADPHAPVSTYLYSEALELYRKGLLTFPDDVIKIWSDNGYGRMMLRRNGNWDPRTPAMPPAGDPGANGIYYHASFFDLQAANHITQMPESPADLVRELNTVLERGGDSLWVVNCSNVKPHVFTLDLIARLWRDGAAGSADAILRDYVRRYYGEASAPAVTELFQGYWTAAASFGGEWDQKCGEQFFNYLPRMIATHYLSGDTGEENDLKWLVQGSFAEQVAWVKSLCVKALPGYERLADDCERVALDIERDAFGQNAEEPQTPDGSGRSAAVCQAAGDTGITGQRAHAARLIRDTIGLQSVIYRESIRGTILACAAVEEALAGDYEHAFYHAGLAREQFLAGNVAMRAREHDVWQGYWANDCLTDVKFSAQVMGALMSYLRNRGDGPHYYGWKHEFCYSAQWRDVIVVLNMENHESDDEIFQAMKRVWGDQA